MSAPTSRHRRPSASPLRLRRTSAPTPHHRLTSSPTSHTHPTGGLVLVDLCVPTIAKTHQADDGNAGSNTHSSHDTKKEGRKLHLRNRHVVQADSHEHQHRAADGQIHVQAHFGPVWK